MGKYTEFFEEQTYDIFNKDDFMDELLKISQSFISFDKALDIFIRERGYQGDDEAELKVKFISEKFKSGNIPVPRNIKKWYSEGKRIERKTAYQICFAFELEIEEVEDFFKRVCMCRGFDCHDMEEIVYFFCFKNKMTYSEAEEIISRLPEVKQGKIDDSEDVVYTEIIIEEIDEIESREELIEYLTENAGMFKYNNVTACKIIKKIWSEIESKDGLAYKEKQKLYLQFNMNSGDLEEQAAGERKARARDDNSIWQIYLRILGLEGNYSSKFYKERSIKEILKNNELMHPLAEDAFPDRDGLTKILNGEHVSHERVRKMLILLVFYRFWVNEALKNNNYLVEDMDILRFYDSINDYLMDAGYPTLYQGNPFDFIIFFSCESKQPLNTFREYMRQLYFVKDEEVYIDKSK